VQADSDRNTAAGDHHHPLRPLAPLGLADGGTPFFAGAKLPSRRGSLHFHCCRSFNSARNVLQMPCSSQPCSRFQRVDGTETRWASPASETLSAESIGFLPVPCDAPSVAVHREHAFAVGEVKARSSATASRSHWQHPELPRFRSETESRTERQVRSTFLFRASRHQNHLPSPCCPPWSVAS
jgi:hypothetical protein